MTPRALTVQAQWWMRGMLRSVLAALFLAASFGGSPAQESTQTQPPSTSSDSTATQGEPGTPPGQLESLVAPIALYPDDLLAQTLVASTYPLEIVQLQQWLAKHKDLEGEALTDSVAKEPWDPSIQSMAGVPEVVDRLANDIQWTTELGNAFLAQQEDVMDAVQRMRKKAQDTGALKTNEQQNVETVVVEQKTVIVVESTNPEVIYVPSYSPVVVYGPPVYPYPPIYYPPYPPGGAFISFSFGVMWGAAWGGSCCGCGWGGNNVNINVDNNFNQINRGDGNRGDGNRGNGGKWQHNPEHRGAAPYGDRATASKYGGAARGDAPGNRATAGRQPGGTGSRAGTPSAGNRATPGTGLGGAGTANRAPGGAGVADRGGASGAGVANRGTGGAGSRGGDQIGNRNIPKSSSPRSGGGFSSGSRGYSGSAARASSSRGSHSMGGRGGAGRGGRR